MSAFSICRCINSWKKALPPLCISATLFKIPDFKISSDWTQPARCLWFFFLKTVNTFPVGQKIVLHETVRSSSLFIQCFHSQHRQREVLCFQMYYKKFCDLVVPNKELYSEIIMIKWQDLHLTIFLLCSRSKIENVCLHQYSISRKGRFLEKLSIILLPVYWVLPKEWLLRFPSVL